jgi:hypothetical protein
MREQDNRRVGIFIPDHQRYFMLVFHDADEAVFVRKIPQFIQRSSRFAMSPMVRGPDGISRFDEKIRKTVVPHRVFGHTMTYLDNGYGFALRQPAMNSDLRPI